MNVRRSASKLALVAAVLSLRSWCAAADPTTAELQAQLKALQEKVTQLENKQQAASQASVDATVKAVMEDAQKRSKLMDVEGFTAGFDNDRFVVRDMAGNFSWSPVVVWQFRNVFNYREDAPGPKGEKTDWGYENRRARLGMQGNVINPDLTYYLVFAGDNSTGVVPLDFYAQYRFDPKWALKFGQFKDPWSQEENVADTKQLAVERSALNALVGAANTDRVQGVAAIYGQGDPIRATAVLHDGSNSKNTNFQDGPATATPQLGGANESFGTTGRVEYFVKGTPKEYEDYSAMGNTENLLVFGAGADWTQAASSNGFFHEFDVQWENTDGVGVYGEYVGLYRDVHTATAGATGVNAGNFYDFGLLGQVAYMIDRHWEVFGRYAYIQLDTAAFTAARPFAQGTVHELTFGANYYMWRHHAKFTVDANYLPTGVPADLPGLGYLTTGGNEFVMRGQFTFAL